MDPHGVRAVVFDAAVLFRVDSTGCEVLVPDAPRFLLRLRYSNLLLVLFCLFLSCSLTSASLILHNFFSFEAKSEALNGKQKVL